MAGNQYPLFAGIHYNYAIPQTDNLWLKLTYTDPSGNSQLVTNEAVAGLSGYSAYESSSSVSSGSDANVDSGVGVNSSLTLKGSNKANYDLIEGVFGGIIAVIVIVAIVLWFVVAKMNKRAEPSRGGSIDRRKDSNESNLRRGGMDVEVGGGALRGVGRSGRLDIRAGSVRSGRMGDSRASRLGSNRSVHAGGVYSSRMGSGRTNHENNCLGGPIRNRHVERAVNMTPVRASVRSSSHR